MAAETALARVLRRITPSSHGDPVLDVVIVKSDPIVNRGISVQPVYLRPAGHAEAGMRPRSLYPEITGEKHSMK